MTLTFQRIISIFLGLNFIILSVPTKAVDPPNRDNRSQRNADNQRRTRNADHQSNQRRGEKWAQGMRGCSAQLGDLALLGAEGDREYLVTTGQEKPIIAYRIVSHKLEEIVITLTEVRGKFERSLIYEKTIISQGNKYLLIQIPTSLKQQQQYQLSAVVLCEGKAAYGKVLDVWLNRVNEVTFLDELVQELLKNETFEAFQVEIN